MTSGLNFIRLVPTFVVRMSASGFWRSFASGFAESSPSSISISSPDNPSSADEPDPDPFDSKLFLLFVFRDSCLLAY